MHNLEHIRHLITQHGPSEREQQRLLSSVTEFKHRQTQTLEQTRTASRCFSVRNGVTIVKLMTNFISSSMLNGSMMIQPCHNSILERHKWVIWMTQMTRDKNICFSVIFFYVYRKFEVQVLRHQ